MVGGIILLPHEEVSLRRMWADPSVSLTTLSQELSFEPRTIVRLATSIGLGARKEDPWPQARVDQMLALNQLGHSCREMAESLGITRGAVIGKLHRLKVPIKSGLKNTHARVYWTASMDHRLQQLWTGGETAHEIAWALGVTRNAVSSRVRKLQLTGRQRSKVEPAPRPKMRVTSQNLVFMESTPRPEFARQAAFEALEGSTPRPWIERTAAQCKWPIGDDHSCCNPVAKAGYCRAHARMAFVPSKPLARRTRDQDREARHYG